MAASGSGSGGLLEGLGFRGGTPVGQMEVSGRPARENVPVDT